MPLFNRSIEGQGDIHAEINNAAVPPTWDFTANHSGTYIEFA